MVRKSCFEKFGICSLLGGHPASTSAAVSCATRQQIVGEWSEGILRSGSGGGSDNARVGGRAQSSFHRRLVAAAGQRDLVVGLERIVDGCSVHGGRDPDARDVPVLDL